MADATFVRLLGVVLLAGGLISLGTGTFRNRRAGYSLSGGSARAVALVHVVIGATLLATAATSAAWLRFLACLIMASRAGTCFGH